MAGSRRWFGYRGDDGKIYNVELDESVAESGLGFTTVDRERPAITVSARRPLKPRYILAQRKGQPAVRRRYIVGSLDALKTLIEDGEIEIDDIEWLITGAVGEKRSVVPKRDTGQDDGDLDVN